MGWLFSIVFFFVWMCDTSKNAALIASSIFAIAGTISWKTFK